MRRMMVLAVALTLMACGKEEDKTPPPPAALTPEAVAYFCGMGIAEHPGPKAQIWLKSKDQPLWFAQVRDAVAFTLLPEEPKDIRVIWVSDMAKAKSWDQPDAWVEAKKAVYVIDSDAKGGMGMDEVVPFSAPAAAQAFVQTHGGRIVNFVDIPGDKILASPPPAPMSQGPMPGDTHGH